MADKSFADLDPEAQKFFSALTPADVKTLEFAMEMARSVRVLNGLTKWLAILLVATITGVASIMDAWSKISAWFKIHP